MEVGGQACGGQNEVDGMVEGVGRRTEEGDWRTGGCSIRMEVMCERADNRPSLITGDGKKLVFECYSFICSNQFICSFQLKEHVGGGAATHCE